MNARHVVSGLWLIATCAGLSLFVPSAQGAGINLSWNNCASDGGTSNQSFACHTNVGQNVLVASFDPPPGITKLVGSSAVIDLMIEASPLPAWWQLAAGGCREGGLQLDLNPVGTLNCIDYWSGAAGGSLSYLEVGGSPARARINLSCEIPEALSGPVEAGNEYYDFRLRLLHTKTVGTGACGGCSETVCLALTTVWLYQPSGMGDHALCNPAVNSWVTWQGPSSFGCPPADLPPPPECSATTTVRRTWGMIKGLYR